MRAMKHLLSLFRRCRAGATAIEFAAVALPFFLILYAIIEYGLILYTQVVIESSTLQVARQASLGKGVITAPGICNREQYVRQQVEQRTRGLINGQKVIVTAATVVQGGVPSSGTPDICMSDPPTIGGPCPTGVYEDVNRNGRYDATVPGVNLGDAGQLVEIRVSYPWKVQIPFFGKYFGEHGVLMISSSTVLRNEPFTGPGC